MEEQPQLIDGATVTPFDTSSTEPLYLLHLPGGKKIQISQDLCTVIHLLDGERSKRDIARELSEQWERKVDEREVSWIIDEKLSPSGIIAGRDSQQASGNSSDKAKGPLSMLFQVPLFSEKQLWPLTSVGQLLFARPVVIGVLILAVVAHVLAYIQLRAAMPAFKLNDLRGDGSLAILLLTGLSAIVHEFGHLSACHRYGVRYGKLGFGLYMFSPVGYVDVTDSWRLPRWRRVVVDLGGIYFQLILNIVLYVLYLSFGKPVFLLTIIAVSAMFVANLNPMFKYDGYWALSDAIGVPNLHKRVGDLWRQILPIPGVKQATAFLQTHTYAKAVMWIYALIVTAYFGYFTWMIIWFAPVFIRDYPSLLITTYTEVRQSIAAGEMVVALGSAFQALFSTFLLVGLVLFVKRFTLSLFRLGKGAVSFARDQWQHRHSEREVNVPSA